MNVTTELIKNHRSIRKFTDKRIEEEILRDIIDAGRWAPSSSHLQAYHIVNIKDENNRRKIRELSGDQAYIESAAEFFVFCGDLNKIKYVCESNGKNFDGEYIELFLIATIDASLVAQNMLIAAESHGLGGVYIGGVRNNIEEVDKLLELPENVVPLFGMCMGYPDQNPIKKPRLPLNLVYSIDKYNSIDSESLEKYDDIVKSYYITRTKGKLDYSWSSYSSERIEGELRPHMLEYLNNKGFSKK